MIEFLIGVVLGMLIAVSVWIIHINKEEKRLRRKYKRK